MLDRLFAATLEMQRGERFDGETNTNPFQAPSAAVGELIGN